MLGVLLESRARRQRRAGGMALSIAAHLAIIGAVTATTVHATRPTRDPIVPVRLAPPVHPAPPTPAQHQPRANTPAARGTPRIVVDPIQVPTVTPTTMPVIDLTPRAMPDYESFRPGTPTGSAAAARSVIDGDGTGSEDVADWRGNEVLMRVVTSGRPRYPDLLRQAGVDGRVLVRFVVDTMGRIDPTSVQVLQSTHDLFARAVRDILGNFRFKPAESNGHRLRAMAEMPFEFQIRR
jgi:protein TonB